VTCVRGIVWGNGHSLAHHYLYTCGRLVSRYFRSKIYYIFDKNIRIKAPFGLMEYNKIEWSEIKWSEMG
jgi:hypothetical protein